MAQRIEVSSGTYRLWAELIPVGNDWLVTLQGGEAPHIGAVAVAQSRPSSSDPQQASASASVICIGSHKEDEIARSAALRLAAAAGSVVTVTAGMHWDDLPQEDIATIVELADTLVDQLLAEIA